MKLKCVSLSAVVLAAVLSACDTNVTFNSEPAAWTDIASLSDFEHSAWEPFDFSLPLADLHRLEVEATNGVVSVTGRPGLTAVRVTGRKGVYAHTLADAKAHLDDLDVIVEDGASAAEVRSWHALEIGRRAYRVEYEIEVPRDWDLSIDQINGRISVAQVTAGVTVRLTNGEIDYAGAVGAGNTVDLSATNANVTVRLEEPTSANVKATVTTGSIFAAGLPLSDRRATATHLEGRLGSGDGSVIVSVINGLIRLATMG